MASPWLNGEPVAYIRDQLIAFAAGKRVNDINGQMRAMARGMTDDEIQEAAAYFAGGTQ
jgi:cytochrome c553